MKIFFFIFIFISTACFPQKKEIRDILYRQDQRLVTDSVLLKYLDNESSEIVSASIIALANIQDSSTIDNLITCLSDKRMPVACNAAFALGQIGPNKRSEDALFSKFTYYDSDFMKSKIFEALGKTGGKESITRFLELNAGNNFLLYHKILSLGRYALRRIRNEKTVEFIINNLTSKDENIRAACAYSLWRTGDKKLLEKYEDKITEMLDDKNAYVRMWDVNIFNTFEAKEKYLKKIFKLISDPDWRVQVNAFKVLEKYTLYHNHLDTVLRKVNDPDKNTSLAAIRFLKNIKLLPGISLSKIFDSLNSIIMNYSGKRAPVERGEAAISISSLVINPDDGYKFISPLLKSGNPRLKAKAITALGNLKSEKILNILIDSIPETEPLITISRIESISKISGKIKLSKENTVKIINLYIKLLNEGDMAVVTTIAGIIQDSANLRLIPFETLINTFNKMKIPDDVEAIVEIIKALSDYKDMNVEKFLEDQLNNPDKTVITAAAAALQKINGKNYRSKIPANSKILYSDYDWEYLEKISINPCIIIETEKGNIKVKLFTAEAPFTVISTCKLIEKNFYKGLVFHRVVPNFVIQGGDPRGDGWGGPGYSIRTEISYLNYKRGMVGIASAGKDTEGCQFFITHSPQPHLDGKYTIFGEVIEGMDVADKIQEGDKIINITRQ